LRETDRDRKRAREREREKEMLLFPLEDKKAERHVIVDCDDRRGLLINYVEYIVRLLRQHV